MTLLSLPLSLTRRRVLAVVRLDGMIAPGRLCLASVRGALEKAFKSGHEVALVINSPGGSPAQSQLIHNQIRRLADRSGKPVTAFVEDVAASGGYWIAAAADRIVALPTSLVGSIGVRSSSFGFHELMVRMGVERRLITAGENKARLDPFSPLSEEDVAWLQGLQAEMHAIFRDSVIARRRGVTGEDTFSGDIWLAAPAQERGLIDGLGDLHGYARERRMTLRPIPVRPPPLLVRLLRRGVETALDVAEERAARARLGL